MNQIKGRREFWIINDTDQDTQCRKLSRKLNQRSRFKETLPEKSLGLPGKRSEPFKLFFGRVSLNLNRWLCFLDGFLFSPSWTVPGLVLNFYVGVLNLRWIQEKHTSIVTVPYVQQPSMFFFYYYFCTEIKFLCKKRNHFINWYFGLHRRPI